MKGGERRGAHAKCGSSRELGKEDVLINGKELGGGFQGVKKRGIFAAGKKSQRRRQGEGGAIKKV